MPNEKKINSSKKSKAGATSLSDSENDQISLNPIQGKVEDKNQPKISSSSNLQLNSVDKSTDNTCSLINLRDAVCQVRLFYLFACFTGILWPRNEDKVMESYTGKNIRYHIWVRYVNYGFVFICTVYLSVGCVVASVRGLFLLEELVGLINYFGYFLQCLFIIPSLYYTRQQLLLPRDVDMKAYFPAFQYSGYFGLAQFVLFECLLIIELIIYIIIDNSTAQQGLFVFKLIFYSTTNLLLTGIYSFLLVEQRVTYHSLTQLAESIKDKTLTIEEYFQTRESIDNRDKSAPINWMIASSLTNTSIAVVLLFIGASARLPSDDMAQFVVYVICAFGRQAIVLFSMLYEISKVNEIADGLPKEVIRYEWKDREIDRLNIYASLKELPVGSTIFFCRPSRFELLAQIASGSLGMGLAILLAFLFS